MCLRTIHEDEVQKLLPCLEALAAYHNKVSHNFKGYYPAFSHSVTLERFKRQLASKESIIAVIGKQQVCGFCKVDITAGSGKIDFLFVFEKQRNKGYGKLLMDWAMQTLKEADCTRIEVKVVDGNEVIHLYEKYGFKINAHILSHNLK